MNHIYDGFQQRFANESVLLLDEALIEEENRGLLNPDRIETRLGLKELLKFLKQIF